MTPDSKR